jgi:hypothetical protein
MKMLLRFYEPTQGEIVVDQSNLNTFSQRTWREHCGSVMQDGFLEIPTGLGIGIEPLIDRIDLVTLSIERTKL